MGPQEGEEGGNKKSGGNRRRGGEEERGGMGGMGEGEYLMAA